MCTIGNRIRNLRNSIGLTQEQVCNGLIEKFGYPITPATLSLYENDKRQLTTEVIVYLAKYYDCSTDYLLLGKEDKSYAIDQELNDIRYLMIKMLIQKIDNMSIDELLDLINKIRS